MTDITTGGHAGVRFARDGRRLVIDPRDRHHLTTVTEERLFGTPLQSPQPPLWEPGEGQWLRVRPLPASHPRRQRHMVGEQLSPFAVAE